MFPSHALMEVRLVKRVPVHHLLVLAALALDTAGHDDPSKRPRAHRYGPLIHLTTLNRDGSPQVSVVWMAIEEDEFVSGHMRLHQKVKNVQRDPRVVFSCLGRGTNPLGLRTYLVVHGKARVTEGGAPALLQRLAPLYLGAGAIFPPETLRNLPGWITRIKPERFGGIGPWNPAET